MTEPKITRIMFKRVARDGSLVGFVGFTYDDKFSFTNVAVHQRLDKKGFRLVYPQNKDHSKPYMFPINRETQQEVDKKINEYLQGAFHEPNENPGNLSGYPKLSRNS